MVSGSFDATVRVWDCRSQGVKAIQVLEGAGDSVSGLDVVGHEIVAGSVDGRVRVYDLRMGMVYVDCIGRMSTCRDWAKGYPGRWWLIFWVRRACYIRPANERWERRPGFNA